MTFTQLKRRLLALPGATAAWLAPTVAFPQDGRPIPVGYCLIRDRGGLFTVYKGDGRGGVSPATMDDGATPLTFATEDDACTWIWAEMMWWRDFEARRATGASEKTEAT
ncbi:hypothetical protein LQ938_13895 [Microbacterium sp. cx-55]|uniref:hypothetical protein n=1 Tax=Microbacterium sp. cx-55 TaxID=2875948 RepID=UPI001CC15745|nr:hypothetical protein [Microbacterium sp. cx-55]MBZ4488283.1 hypothetical protein [Microbacterium sp. cx-55]UGB34944.1 hypothetical protein LQ938_13895 [Microbacterium sp. cx-55]